MTTRHPAPRRSGAPPQPPSGLRRPHTPRSHVFSGVPPPDLHTLNLQRQLDEARTRADDLAKQVASQAEEIQALKEAAAATTTATTAAAGTSSKAQEHTRPSAASPSPPAPLRRSVSDSMPEPLFPVDAAVTEHLAFLSTLIDGATPPPNPNSATVWGALTGYYDALDKKCAEVSAQACVLAAEKDALLVPGGLPQPLPSLEGVSLASSETPSPTNTNGSGGPGAVSAAAAAAAAAAATAAAAAPDVRVQAARVLSRNSSVMSQPHPAAYPSLRPSGASPSPVSAVRRAASGGAYAAPRVPAEVFDFLRQVPAASSQSACASYVKKLQGVLRKHKVFGDVAALASPTAAGGKKNASSSQVRLEHPHRRQPHPATTQHDRPKNELSGSAGHRANTRSSMERSLSMGVSYTRSASKGYEGGTASRTRS